MAQAGANVVVLDLDATGLGETEAACRKAGHEVLTMSVDVTKGDSLAAAADVTRERFGAIHALINSAGTLGPSVPIVDCDEADWQRVFDINVKGTFLATKHYIALIRKGGGGAIVNFSSAAGLVGSNELGPYSASKGAVVLMTRSMALNHASEGIRVNCVCPASIDTPMLRATFEIAGDEEARRERYEKFPVWDGERGRTRGAVPGQRRCLFHHRNRLAGGRRPSGVGGRTHIATANLTGIVEGA
jgi:NAD(P)-dependent dehydrogenase (short-subunit alcohol dehydrogenase family)